MIISTIAEIQMALIGMGAFLEATAVSVERTLCKREHVHEAPPECEQREKTIAPVCPNKIVVKQPTRPGKDYYEMEEVPAGVRPADLMRTAKVRYIQAP